MGPATIISRRSLIVSAYAADPVVSEDFAYPDSDFLPKPFCPRVLDHRVEKIPEVTVDALARPRPWYAPLQTFRPDKQEIYAQDAEDGFHLYIGASTVGFPEAWVALRDAWKPAATKGVASR